MMITCGGDGHGEFAKVVNGVTYDIGIMKINPEELNIKKLL